MLTNFKTRLKEKKLLVDNVHSFIFELVEPKEINFIAGQYMMLKVPKGEGYVYRMYSIASSPLVKNSFELIVEIVPQGLGSTYLSNLTVGQEVDFMGPGGVFVAKEDTRKKIFLVTGTGIAPVRSILLQGLKNYELYWGMKTLKNVYMLEELKDYGPKICLSREENLNTIPDADRQYFDLGHVDTVFEKAHPNLTEEDLKSYEFYLCGSRHVVESLRVGLLAKSIPKELIHFEKF